MLKVYNSLTRRKEVFKPINKNLVKIYSCGPTVYNYVHIGNLRSYVFMDTIVKTLKYLGYDVVNVMNITDIDDKTIRDSKCKIAENPNEVLKEFTKKYEEEFFKDLERLNIQRPVFVPRASETIKEMNDLIAKLYEKGYAYITDDGIYFDISKDSKYGQLVKLNLDKLKYNRGNRVVVDEYSKENVNDFALWKFRKENEPYWEIELDGKKYEGRPGWHIECSAMSYKYLGEHFDMHTGGIDLKFPHHENEIAQSECANGVKFVNYWLHNEFLLVDGKKMSKSLNNFYTLRDILKKGYRALALRYLFLSVHYRQQLNFTYESLKGSMKALKRINDFNVIINNLIPKKGGLNIKNDYLLFVKEFKEALEDDFNLPIALSVFFEFMNYVYRNINLLTGKDIELIKRFINDFNSVFSVLEEIKIPTEIKELGELRKKMKNEKKYEEADEIREVINQKGFEIKDFNNVKDGYLIFYKYDTNDTNIDIK